MATIEVRAPLVTAGRSDADGAHASAKALPCRSLEAPQVKLLRTALWAPRARLVDHEAADIGADVLCRWVPLAKRTQDDADAARHVCKAVVLGLVIHIAHDARAL